VHMFSVIDEDTACIIRCGDVAVKYESENWCYSYQDSECPVCKKKLRIRVSVDEVPPEGE
jgi:C4-type Zn-finger protein